MQCHVCGNTVAPDDRFCTTCGASLAGVTDATERLDADDASGTATPREPDETTRVGTTSPPGDADDTARATAEPPDDPSVDGSADHWTDDDPVWAVTGSVDTIGQPTTDPPSTDQLPATQPITGSPSTDQLPATQPVTGSPSTDQLPATQPVTGSPSTDQLPATQPITGSPSTDQLPATQPITGSPSTDQLPATQPITDVRTTEEPASGRVITAAPPADAWHDDHEAVRTTAVATTPSATAELPVFPTPIAERRHFRFTAVFWLSFLCGTVALLALFATIVSITSDIRLARTSETPAAFRTGDWISTDLADNLPIAGLIAVCLLVAGGVAAAFGWRGGSGLAGGAGLAVAGLAALTIGLAQYPIDAAYEMAKIPSEQQFTLTITRDLGYWLLIAAGALGVVVFFASINDTFGDRRRGLNPWIAALGALAGLVMAAGPLIPEHRATFSDNWYVSDAPGAMPAMLLAGRLVQLALLAVAALIGFLVVRRWGLGVAVGAGLPAIWLTVSTMLELGDNPAGPGYRNPGATSMHVHGVTIIGASALAAFALLAIVAAYDQAARGH